MRAKLLRLRALLVMCLFIGTQSGCDPNVCLTPENVWQTLNKAAQDGEADLFVSYFASQEQPMRSPFLLDLGPPMSQYYSFRSTIVDPHLKKIIRITSDSVAAIYGFDSLVSFLRGERISTLIESEFHFLLIRSGECWKIRRFMVTSVADSNYIFDFKYPER